MKLIVYEIRKICGIKNLWLLLAVCFAANCVLCVITAEKESENMLPREYAEIIFDAYREDPDKVLADYENYTEASAELEQLLIEADMNGIVLDEKPTVGNVYSSDENYPDSLLYEELMSSTAVKGYGNIINELIDSAETNLSRYEMMNISQDSFQYRYQEKLIDRYGSLLGKVDTEVEYVYGWGSYFAYDSVNIFIFFAVLTISGIVFIYDKDIGFSPIIGTAKKGRLKTAAAKIGAAAVFCFGTVITFTLSSFLIFGVVIGYSPASSAMQCISDYVYCPFALTVGQYFLLSTVIRIVAVMLWSVAVLILSVIFYKYILTYIAGAVLFGINFLFYSFDYLGTSNPLEFLNLLSAASPGTFALRYRAVNIFGYAFDLIVVFWVSFCVLITVLILITIILYLKNTFTTAHINTGISVKKVMTKISGKITIKSHRKSYAHSLILWETYKTLRSPSILFAVIILFVVNIYTSSLYYNATETYTDTAYENYMNLLEGPLNDEKKDYIMNERDYINTTISKKADMDDAVSSGEISMDEYIDYLTEYNYAKGHEDALSIVESQEKYLERISSEKNITGCFLYDTGWNAFFTKSANLYFLASLILLFANCFSRERNSKSSQGNFSQILRVTVKGRHKTFLAKVLTCMIISTALSLVFTVADFILVSYRYNLPSMSAPLVSLQIFADTDTGITISQYILLIIILKTVAAVIVSLFVCGISEILRKDFATFTVAAGITVLPALLVYFGFKAVETMNFLSFLAGTPLYLDSTSSQLFNTDCYGLVIYIAATLLVTLLVIAKAERSWIK
jgi:hypothetical protein